jgi:hypothetical protein
MKIALFKNMKSFDRFYDRACLVTELILGLSAVYFYLTSDLFLSFLSVVSILLFEYFFQKIKYLYKTRIRDSKEAEFYVSLVIGIPLLGILANLISTLIEKTITLYFMQFTNPEKFIMRDFTLSLTYIFISFFALVDISLWLFMKIREMRNNEKH